MKETKDKEKDSAVDIINVSENIQDKVEELNIYQAIPMIMKEIGVIEKSRTNPSQGYSFRGIDEIFNAANSVLSKYKVFPVPSILEMRREERTNRNGTVLLYTILTMKYTFFASDGSYIEAMTVGEAMDSGDKSCNKAMSAAQKYAFLQIFCIPTEEPKDTELETHEVSAKKEHKYAELETQKITTGQISLLYDLAGKSKYTNTEIKNYIAKEYKVDSVKELIQAHFDDLKSWLEKGAL